jgi:hypothetical protein
MPSSPAEVATERPKPRQAADISDSTVYPVPFTDRRTRASSGKLFTPGRKREAGRIVLVGAITLLHWIALLPRWVLLSAVALGL